MILTKAIFESLLDNRVIDIGQNLEILYLLPHTLHSVLLLGLILWRDVLLLQPRKSFSLYADSLQLLLPILLQNFSCLLETLVWQLLEGDLLCLLQKSSSTAGSNRSLSSLGE